jgi:Tol biopolymer transport system component
MQKPLFLLLVFVSHLHSFAQQSIRKFPPSINHPAIDIYAPFISMDGSSLVFTSPYGLEREQIIYYSQKGRGDWKQPTELPKHLNNRLTLEKSYTLSPDGSTLYITSIKSGGVGGFDIWYSEFKGNTWSEIRNIFAPINSKMQEGSPTFTPDGKTIFFMRCEKMTQQKAESCKIFFSKKNATGQWQEPVELPDYINAGNSQMPRIMADGETLIFCSDKLKPNKGGMDLYITKLQNSVWSNPIPLDFVNTSEDDMHASAVATGRYLIKDSQGERKREVVEYLIPDDLRPKGVMKIEGIVRNAEGSTTPAYISIIDISNNKRVFNARPDKDGSFFSYINEGSKYELSIEPEVGTHTYFSKQYDLTGNDIPMVDKVEATLKPFSVGDELTLDALKFKKNRSELEDASSELRRLTRLLKSSDLNFEVQVLLAGYQEDSIQSNPDLTEVTIDTVIYTLEDIDTLGQLVTYDSVVTKTRYHNNRTEKQALAIINQLVALGVNREKFTYFFNARPEAIIENRKTSVRILAKQKK